MVSIKLVLIIWLVCSLVSTILYIAFDNDTVTGLLAIGPVGWVLSIICFLVNKIHRFFKYHFKRCQSGMTGTEICIMLRRR